MGVSTILRRSASRVVCGGSFTTTRNLVISAVSISNGHRQFSSYPDLSNCKILQQPISNESLAHEILSLRSCIQLLQEDVESLRRLIHNHELIPKIKLEGTQFTQAMATHFNTSQYEGTNHSVGESVQDPKKTSPFSEAMATYFNTVATTSDGTLTTEAMATHFTNEEGKKTSPFSEAMSTHFNTIISATHPKETNQDQNKTSPTHFNKEETSKFGGPNESLYNEEMTNMEKMTRFTEAINNHFNSETVDDNKVEREEMTTINIETCDDSKVEGSVATSDESVLNWKEKEETLIRGLESEISHASDFNLVYSEEDFPFKLEKAIWGTEEIYLSREFEGERIQINVHKLNVYNAAVSRFEMYNQLKEHGQFTMRLTVEVSGAASHLKKVVLGCFGYRNKVMIDFVKNPDDGTDNEGLQFNKLNKDLQDGFYEYLETRGISSTTINILYEFMLRKVHRKHATFFRNFKNMLEA